MKIKSFLCLLLLCLTCAVLSACEAAPKESATAKQPEYETALFEPSYVHEVAITMSDEDWADLKKWAMDKKKYVCSVSVDGEAFGDVQVSAKGNNTLESVIENPETDCYSLKLTFDGINKEQTYHGLDVLSLNNCINEYSQMRDYMTCAIYNELNVPVSLASYAHLTVNGEGMGLYLALENLDKSFLKRNGLEDAELYKPADDTEAAIHERILAELREQTENGTLEANLAKMADGNMSRNPPPNAEKPAGADAEPFVTDTEEEAHGAELMYLGDDPENYTEIFDNSVKNCSDKDKKAVIVALKNLSEQKVEGYIDTDEVIRYFAGNSVVLNADSYLGKNLQNYFLCENNGTLMMFPWDSSRTFYNSDFFGMGRSFEEQANLGIDEIISNTRTREELPMWNWIVSDEKWRTQYHETLDALIAGYFESGRCDAEIDRVSTMIRPYIDCDDTGINTVEQFDEAVAELKAFCRMRAVSIRKQLSGELPTGADET